MKVPAGGAPGTIKNYGPKWILMVRSVDIKKMLHHMQYHKDKSLQFVILYICDSH